MNENTNVPVVDGTCKVNLPSESVTVPFAVPFKITLTPGSGDPSSDDVTRPETGTFCASAPNHGIVRHMQVKSKNFLILFGFELKKIKYNRHNGTVDGQM